MVISRTMDQRAPLSTGNIEHLFFIAESDKTWVIHFLLNEPEAAPNRRLLFDLCGNFSWVIACLMGYRRAALMPHTDVGLMISYLHIHSGYSKSKENESLSNSFSSKKTSASKFFVCLVDFFNVVFISSLQINIPGALF